jgi:hypothetical protein
LTSALVGGDSELHAPAALPQVSDNAIALKYIDLVSKSEQFPEDGQERPKHVIGVILMLF